MFLRLLSVLLFLNSTAFAAPCDSNDFKRLLYLVQQGRVSNAEFAIANDIARKLETAKCYEYEIKHDGQVQGVVSLTQLFGGICKLRNAPQAVTAYVVYMDNYSGAADGQLAVSFESMFRENPAIVLNTITNGGERIPYDLLEKLARGFVNNSNAILDAENYRDVFFQLHPDMPLLYQKYSRQIDIIFSTVETELKK